LPLVLPLLVFVALSGVRLPMVSALIEALYAQGRLDRDDALASMGVKTLWTRS